jgi:hypothetical protein
VSLTATSREDLADLGSCDQVYPDKRCSLFPTRSLECSSSARMFRKRSCKAGFNA